MSKKVLITGVGGFIGSKIALKFLNEGFEVVGIDDFSMGKIENVPPEVNLIIGDLSDSMFVNTLPNDCKYILHIAGQSSGEISFDNPTIDLHKNTISTNVLNIGVAVIKRRDVPSAISNTSLK